MEIAHAFHAGIPDKSLYFVAEVIPIVARTLGISDDAARGRIYRRINNGTIRAEKIMGPTRISKAQLDQILRGEIE
jgi:hypothetical protein